MTVEFDSDAPYQRQVPSPRPSGGSSGGLAGWLAAKGIVRSKQSAEIALGILALALVAASIFFWKRSSGITQAPGASFYVRNSSNR